MSAVPVRDMNASTCGSSFYIHYGNIELCCSPHALETLRCCSISLPAPPTGMHMCTPVHRRHLRRACRAGRGPWSQVAHGAAALCKCDQLVYETLHSKPLIRRPGPEARSAHLGLGGSRVSGRGVKRAVHVEQGLARVQRRLGRYVLLQETTPPFHTRSCCTQNSCDIRGLCAGHPHEAQVHAADQAPS